MLRAQESQGLCWCPGSGTSAGLLAHACPCGIIPGLLVTSSPCSPRMDLPCPPGAPVAELEQLQLPHAGLASLAPPRQDGLVWVWIVFLSGSLGTTRGVLDLSGRVYIPVKWLSERADGVSASDSVLCCSTLPTRFGVPPALLATPLP